PPPLGEQVGSEVREEELPVLGEGDRLAGGSLLALRGEDPSALGQSPQVDVDLIADACRDDPPALSRGPAVAWRHLLVGGEAGTQRGERGPLLQPSPRPAPQA